MAQDSMMNNTGNMTSSNNVFWNIWPDVVDECIQANCSVYDALCFNDTLCNNTVNCYNACDEEDMECQYACLNAAGNSTTFGALSLCYEDCEFPGATNATALDECIDMICSDVTSACAKDTVCTTALNCYDNCANYTCQADCIVADNENELMDEWMGCEVACMMLFSF